ncbi:rhomboid family intramembrane serine protease [Pleomorphomonas sp. NRK KF1]|uniref:rhomboid family intramembrane serine protease n=1 Tax=Pleomorphomonas sp. NRK KF1 TaxID=2943000 RepID=UPI00204325DE|nr:rhomboid family intramembrane serine protease [Pleomorphomonas sp. NRK KF1]MCM5555449.1 rhomboid family intramembrane serine protease [Pleomorphomonas sp. NRK KF1]
MQGDNDNHEPMFNLPRVILAFILLSAGIFIGRTWYLGGDGAATFLLTFCFTPMRYQYLLSGDGFPGGWPAGIWSPFTYSFISPSLQSLIFDMLWLTAFGTAVARRFGPWRFVGFSAAASAIGAALFWLLAGSGETVLLGPNFVVAALLGAAIRFIYAAGLGGIMTMGGDAWRQPALGIIEMWSNVRVLQLLGFIFAANALFAILYASSGLDGRALLQNALGYIVGILLFSLFDPRPSAIDRAS